MTFRVLVVIVALTIASSSHGDSLSSCLSCPPRWTRWENNCYRFYSTPKLNFGDAEAICNQFVPFEETCPCYTAHLASIESAKENEFLLEWWRTIRKPDNTSQNFRIGYTDATEEGVWCWVDGSPSNYTNWDHNQPDNGRSRQHCAVIWSRHGDNGEWDDQKCSNKQPFMCKFRLL